MAKPRMSLLKSRLFPASAVKPPPEKASADNPRVLFSANKVHKKQLLRGDFVQRILLEGHPNRILGSKDRTQSDPKRH